MEYKFAVRDLLSTEVLHIYTTIKTEQKSEETPTWPAFYDLNLAQ